jgi:DNA (cytosine-5)-methyltransferase 1
MATLCATDNEKWGCNQWVNEGKAILHPIAIAENTIGRQPQNGGNGDGFTVGGPMYTLNATGVHGVAQPIPLNSMNCFRSPDAAASTGCGIGEVGEAMFTLTKTNHHAVAQPIAFTTEQTPKFNENQALTLTKSEAKHNQSVLTEMAVRRLTPVECERLQGFPDNYTNIPWRKKDESPDGPRYKALGNSMAVPVMKWIGQRIKQVENA